MTIIRRALALIAFATIGGCVSYYGPPAYSVGAIGDTTRSVVATVVDRRPIEQSGMISNEYVVQTDNGSVMTIAQTSGAVFRIGARVTVIYGTPPSLVAAP